jgi:metal-responsive CopG/Arc/MetJ family transcriptional regulator
MTKVNKISISLPEDILKAIELERKENGESRSQVIRRSIEMLLREKKEKKLKLKYIQAYQKIPETVEEVNAAHYSASQIIAQEPW